MSEMTGNNILDTVDSAWYVRESLRGSFMPWVPQCKRIVIVTQVYNIYRDESGTHRGAEIVVVAGFISNVDRWVELSAAWLDALKSWGIDSFHMTDFENRQNQFRGWSETQRKECLNHLIDLINGHTFNSIGYAVPGKSFDTILSEKARRLCGDAYGLASIGCFTNTARVARTSEDDVWIDYVMESGAKGRGALLYYYGEGRKDPDWRGDTRIHSLEFRDKRDFPPLQAADILAYELYKHLPRQLRGELQRDRYPLRRLHKRNRQWHYAEDDELRNVNIYLTDLWDRWTSG